MSKFVRKNSIKAIRFGLVAFKDTLSTGIFPVDDLTGPKIKCVGATVKVTSNNLVQKGTIVTISENRESLAKQCEYFNVRKYFGLSTRTKSVQGTNVVKKETILNKRSVSVAGPITVRNVNKNSTPISTRRSVRYNRPLPSPIVDPTDPYKFLDTPSPIRSMSKRPTAKPRSSSKPATTRASTGPSQRLITDYFPRKTQSYSDETIEYVMDALDETNLSDVFEEDHDDKSIILVNKLDNLFDMLPESLATKQLREELDDEVNTSNSTTSSYITNNHGICFARDVILSNATDNSNVIKYLDLQQSARKSDSDTSTNSTATTTIYITKLVSPTDNHTTTSTSPSPTSTSPSPTSASPSPTSTSPSPTSTSPSPTTSPSKSPTTSRDIYDDLTPMELLRRLMWKRNYGKLDVNLLTKDVLQEIKQLSKTPEIFARNLMYRLFTIEELKGCNVYGTGYTNGIRNGRLNSEIVKSIHQLTYRMFPFVKFSWQNCVRWMNKSIKYVTGLIPEKTAASNPEQLPDVTPILSSTIIQHSDSPQPPSTVDVSLIELGSSALTYIVDNSFVTYYTIPKPTIHRDSSVYIPSLITTTPESWEDSLLQLSNLILSAPLSWEHSLLHLRTIQPTVESWEDSLLHISTKNIAHALCKAIQFQLSFKNMTPESWEDSLLQLSFKNMTPESWEDSLLQLSFKNMTPESWEDSLLQLPFKNMTPESWEDSLLQLSFKNMTPESWEDSLLQPPFKNMTPESWEDSLLQLKNMTPESWEDSLLQLSFNNMIPESWEDSLLQLSFKNMTPESWEDSLLQLPFKNMMPESWEDSLLQLSFKNIMPESWEDSLLQLSFKNMIPESWEDSLLQLPFKNMTPESWEDCLLQLSLKNMTPESWEDSLLQLSFKNMTPESREDSLLQLSLKNMTPESWEDSLLQLSFKNMTPESREDSLLQLSFNNMMPESLEESLLQLSFKNMIPESWEDSLLQLSFKDMNPESLEDSLLQLFTNNMIPESWEDSLLQLSLRNMTLDSRITGRFLLYNQR